MHYRATVPAPSPAGGAPLAAGRSAVAGPAYAGGGGRHPPPGEPRLPHPARRRKSAPSHRLRAPASPHRPRRHRHRRQRRLGHRLSPDPPCRRKSGRATGFIGMESHSDDNGTAAWMRTAAGPGGALLVSGSGTEPYAAPPGALPVDLLEPGHPAVPPLFSSQDGRLCVQSVVSGPRSSWFPVSAARCRRGATTCMATSKWWSGTTHDDQWAHMRLWRHGSVITPRRPDTPCMPDALLHA